MDIDISLRIPSSVGEPLIEIEASQQQNLYTPHEQKLYDSVAGDGKLRNAAELFREVEKRRAVELGEEVCGSSEL